jgi:peptide/nickel transport system permease protein
MLNILIANLPYLLKGAVVTLWLSLIVVTLGTILGTVIGLIVGYFRGIVDDTISRLVDAVLALPLIIVAVLALVSLGTSSVTVVVVIGLVFAPIIARTVRTAVMLERQLDYVAAAKLRGENAFYIMFVEILPNVSAPILVEATVRLGYAIFTVATLSFLGFGIQPPSPDWGLAISESYGMINGGAWWTVLFDALAIASLVVAVNLVADAIHGVFET